ncbi:MAG TPA: RidA family protein [Thermoanaerobaculia bacterium]|jgi:2-iminobutanoate/2-iminopropanoate deaminase|nr:RidA family protein [Thermoanaerobaculia bacterium]
MPIRTCITTPNAPPPIGPYCQGNIAGPFVFTAEEGGEKPDGTLPKTIEAQTDQVINNIEAILKAGYCSLDDVTKVTVYLASLSDFKAMNGIYAKRFKQPYPVRSIIQTALPAPGALVAMDAIALRPQEGKK